VANAGPFCCSALLATRYHALRYNKSSNTRKRKRKCCSSNKAKLKRNKKEGNAAALTKAKG
jgi:hypothetical protein